MDKKKFREKGIEFGGSELFLISGPCVIEDDKVMMTTAEALKRLSEELKLPVIFKSSFQKDNRSNIQNYTGPGLEAGLKVLAQIKKDFGFLVLSDIHSPEQAKPAAEVLDIIQIPAYLCMQTSLLVAAAKTGRILNIKHGQFLAPKNMIFPVTKCVESGNDKIMLTERGHSFGYNDLVVDPRSFYEMNQLRYPVIFDLTHSIRNYGTLTKEKAGGAFREYLPVLARAGAAAGIDGVFIEAHPNPDKALCDAANQIALPELKPLVSMIREFHALEAKFRI